MVESKTEYVGLRLTAEEAEFLARKAKEDGRTVSGYIRRLIKDDMKQDKGEN